MSIFITGGTGFTGQRVLPLLRNRGPVRCLVRSQEKLNIVKQYGYEAVMGTLDDFDRLTECMKGCDTLINIASIGFGHAENVVSAAEKAGIKRAVFLSTTAIFTNLNARSKNTRIDAEECIRTSRLKWTIVRPTMIYGAPDDRNMIRLIRFIDRFPIVPVPGGGNFLQQPVYVEDVARAIISIIEHQETICRDYNIGGKYRHSFNEVIDIVARVLSKKICKFHVPYSLALGAARIYERIFPRSFITSEQIARLNEHKHFDYSAAREAFHYDPISFEEGINKEVGLCMLNRQQKS